MENIRGPRTGAALALSAALLFGLSAPAAKVLVGAVDPWLLAGLLYLGSGAGLTLYRLIRGFRGRSPSEAALAPRDVPWLGGAILAGGVIGPVLLMFGLARGAAAQSALLLNLEGVFTAALAWFVFREHFHARILVGMMAITSGALVLAWGGDSIAVDRAALLVVGACVAWAVDNNLTRAVSGGDPVQIAALKGSVAGLVNVLIASARGAPWPSSSVMLLAGLVGVLGYGASLVLFVLALRQLGTGRTSAYFSTAPFVGALVAIAVLGDPFTTQVFVAAVLMTAGVRLHLTEHHDHEHVHEAFEHEHAHRHDEHHAHPHPAGTPPDEPHTHVHTHTPLRHAHPHYPDLHHRHGH